MQRRACALSSYTWINARLPTRRKGRENSTTRYSPRRKWVRRQRTIGIIVWRESVIFRAFHDSRTRPASKPDIDSRLSHSRVRARTGEDCRSRKMLEEIPPARVGVSRTRHRATCKVSRRPMTRRFSQLITVRYEKNLCNLGWKFARVVEICIAGDPRELSQEECCVNSSFMDHQLLRDHATHPPTESCRQLR